MSEPGRITAIRGEVRTLVILSMFLWVMILLQDCSFRSSLDIMSKTIELEIQNKKSYEDNSYLKMKKEFDRIMPSALKGRK